MSEPSVWRAGRQGERERGGDSGSRGVTRHLPRASDACVHPPSHSEYVSCIALCLLPGTRQVLRKLLWQGQSLCLSAPSTVSRECASHASPAEFRRCSESHPAQWARPRAGGRSRAPGDQPKRRQKPASCHSNSSGKTDDKQRNKALERDSWWEASGVRRQKDRGGGLRAGPGPLW